MTTRVRAARVHRAKARLHERKARPSRWGQVGWRVPYDATLLNRAIPEFQSVWFGKLNHAKGYAIRGGDDAHANPDDDDDV